ncbi:pre-mRNA-splicing factor cwc22 [Blomia tropicalis]|nr:pre-mRNA-splicing factor cwc22 [Blomia tropicalis]
MAAHLKMDASQDIRTKTGGAYIPPAKLRMMQQSITDKNGEAYQRLAWEALKKSINGLINKVNISNIAIMVKELFEINMIRGRGLFCRAIMRAQMSSPTFTHVYAALVAVCNTKFPKVGELLIKRLIIQFRRTFQRNDKNNCINTVRFIAHLVNQSIVHELLALEILILLLDNATDDSVEVAIAFVKECGSKLTDVASKATAAIFETLRNILHDAVLGKRVQYMIEVIFAVRRDNFKDHPSILPELDLVEEADQTTHMLELSEDYETEDRLNVFKFDPDFQDNEAKYDSIKKEILGDGDSDESSDSSGGSDSDDEDSNDDSDGGDPGPTGTTDSSVIIDNTETDLITLRKTIYLTIQSSLDFEECAHKLLKLEINESQYEEMCNMIVDCCAQQRTYIKFFGLLAQRFCQLNTKFCVPFTEIFKNCYDTIHRFETCKLRNVAKLFAHLFHTDAIPWTILSHIKLNEFDTTSSSRVFIKILFQQLAESLGLVRLNARIKDVTLQEAFDGLFPRNEPQNTRFAINFFTSIGLGGLTDDLREHLKTMVVKQPNIGLESLAANINRTQPIVSTDYNEAITFLL